MDASQPASLTFDSKATTLSCGGHWTLSGVVGLVKEPLKPPSRAKKLSINGKDIAEMDTAGAWALWQKVRLLENSGISVKFSEFSPENESLLHLVENSLEKTSKPIPVKEKNPWLYTVGEKTVQQYFSLATTMSFIGELVITLGNILRKPIDLQWKSLLNVVDNTGFRALPIVGLLCFLIGIVLAYQMGLQLKTYGANVYIISFLGIGVLQEFGPLITAIIVAGRTSSAFTAELGTMQINEEIDALRTMGVSTMVRLVVPKVLGLIIALPLLTLWADIFGVFGGMIVANNMLDISYYNFLLNFPQMIQLTTLMNGLIKTPVFALIISGVGCYQGFMVVPTSDSIGKQTTKSVVQAIFLIIVADAIFSIILPWQSV